MLFQVRLLEICAVQTGLQVNMTRHDPHSILPKVRSELIDQTQLFHLSWREHYIVGYTNMQQQKLGYYHIRQHLSVFVGLIVACKYNAKQTTQGF